MQTQSESLHYLGHLHARSSSTASGAGFPSIQSIVRLDSSSAELPIFHPNPTESGIEGLHCRLRLQNTRLIVCPHGVLSQAVFAR